jgi:hypothetical protein
MITSETLRLLRDHLRCTLRPPAAEDFLEGFNQPTYRGMRINGQRVAMWSSKKRWSGDSRPEAEWLQ